MLCLQSCTRRHGKSLRYACNKGLTFCMRAAGDCSRLLVLAAMASCQAHSALLLEVSARLLNVEAGPSEEPPSEQHGRLHACVPEPASAGPCPMAACAEGCLAGGMQAPSPGEEAVHPHKLPRGCCPGCSSGSSSFTLSEIQSALCFRRGVQTWLKQLISCSAAIV